MSCRIVSWLQRDGMLLQFRVQNSPTTRAATAEVRKERWAVKEAVDPSEFSFYTLTCLSFSITWALMVPRCCKFQSKFQKLPSKLYPRYPQWCFQVPSSYPYPNRSYQMFLILVSFPCRHTSAWQRWRLPWQSQNRWIIVYDVYANMVNQILPSGNLT